MIKKFKQFESREENDNETLEAKLRNKLSPFYNLAKMVLAMEKNPKIKDLVIKEAEKVIENRKIIDELLLKIEEQNKK